MPFAVSIRRIFLIALAAWAPLLPAAHAADAPYPNGVVRVIIPFPPGGPTDTMGRIIGQKLQELWGQPVIIDYKPGAGTVIGVDVVAKAPPNGLTIGIVNSSYPINPLLRKTMPYDTVKDLVNVTQIAKLQLALIANPQTPFNTVPELVAYAKAHPRELSYATPGAGGTSHLAGELLNRAAGIDLMHVPYKGSAPAQADLMGGRVQLMVDPFFSALPFVKAGRLKFIATAGEKRVPGYEQYPTIAETYPGFVVSALLGFVAPAATPKHIVQKLQADVARVLLAPDVKQRIEELGMEVVASRPEEFDAFVHSEMSKWGKVIAAAHIQIEQ